jgi:tetratricopeptide (TPR) repeat protein
MVIFIAALKCDVTADGNKSGNGDISSVLGKAINRFNSAYNIWQKDSFTVVNQQFSRIASIWPESSLPHYWQGVVQFHLVSHTLFGLPEHRDKKAAKKYVEKALKALHDALELQPDDAESLALLGTLTGIKIFLSPLQAPVLGPRVMSSIKEALAIDSTSPRVYYLAGVSYYNTPALMGGGVDKGLPYLLKAEKLYRREAAQPVRPESPRWGRSTCLGFIAKTYAKKKEYTQARRWYRRALDVNPYDKMAEMGLRDLEKRKNDFQRN